MKRIIQLLFILLIVYNAKAQTTYLDENFDAGVIPGPALWSVGDAGSNPGDSWEAGMLPYQSMDRSLDGTNCVFVDANSNGNSAYLYEVLTAPNLYPSAGTGTLLLEFDQFYRQNGNSSATVEVYNGLTFDPVLVNTATIGDFNNPNHQSIDITAYRQVPNLIIRFVYDEGENNWGWWWMIDNVKVSDQPICEPTYTLTAGDDCANSDGYFVDFNFTSYGSSAFMSVADDQGNAPVILTSAPPAVARMGPYASDTTVNFTLTNEICTIQQSILVNIHCPPQNDLPSNATTLTVGRSFEDEAIVDDNHNATASEATDPSIPTPTFCQPLTGSANYQGGDVWYRVVVPADGSVVVEVAEEPGSPINNTGLAIYSGTPSNLSQITCIDNSGFNFFSKATVLYRTPGEILYARAWEHGNDTQGNFRVSAYAPTSYVPDDNFENYLETHDANGNTVAVGDASSMGNGIANDDFVLTSSIGSVTNLNVSNKSIADLTGIADFEALTVLNCSSNNLTILSVLQNTNLQELNYNNNNIENIDLTQHPNLQVLQCHSNGITNLNLSVNTALKELNCLSNNLTSIDLSNNTNLELLFCSSNNLTSIDLRNNTNLERLTCFTNNLTSLDLSNNTALTFLYCHNNNLTSLVPIPFKWVSI